MTHTGLPVGGYRAQSDEAVALVNTNKEIEERVLRILDELEGHPGVDLRWLRAGRTQIEMGFMAVNRSIFQPGRIRLPEDDESGLHEDDYSLPSFLKSQE